MIKVREKNKRENSGKIWCKMTLGHKSQQIRHGTRRSSQEKRNIKISSFA